MEMNYFNLFYAGISEGGFPEAGKKLIKTGLPVEKVEREFPYRLGSGRKEGGRLRIFYTLLPEYRGRTVWKKRPKRWKEQVAEQLIGDAMEKAFRELECREQIFSPKEGQSPQQVPPEVLAACLYRYRPFDRICVSLPEKEKRGCAEQAIELLAPYLSRMRQVMLIGGEESEAELLEDYLCEEFGIIMTKGWKVPSGTVWLDLKEGRSEREMLSGQSRGLKYVNPREALKFLDTLAKNGYNTGVNQT